MNDKDPIDEDFIDEDHVNPTLFKGFDKYFVNYHRHTCYSLYDGANNPVDGVKYAHSLGQTAIGISDHGTMGGVIEHYRACKELGMNPILGVEAYFMPKFVKEQGKPYFHMSLFAKNVQGYHNLCRAVTEANTEHFYYRGHMDFSTLKKYSEGVIMLSGCIASLPAQLVIDNRPDLAEKAIQRFLDIFGENFYFEVMPNKMPEQVAVNTFIIEMAKKYNRPVIMTIDSHYVRSDEYNTHQVFKNLGTEEGQERLHADYSKLYMPSGEEAMQFWHESMWGNGSDYIMNGYALSQEIDIDLTFQEMVPKMGGEKPAHILLTERVKKGLVALGKWNEEYRARVRDEFNVIVPKGFTDYFLLCATLVQYARDHDIPVGTGRGSVCGSLVAYALGITTVDPIQLGIGFERFLNPSRSDQPDIDMDFCAHRRDEVIAYAMQLFQGRSAPLGNVIRWKVDNTINDLGKHFGMTKTEINHLKLLLEALNYQGKQQSYQELLKNKDIARYDAEYGNIVLHFTRMYRQVKGIGRHAAGLAVVGDDINKFVPIKWIPATKSIQTELDKYSLPFLGILKMDILGLATATQLHMAAKTAGIDLAKIPYDDEETFQAFREGNCLGIFQLERRNVIKMVQDVAPDNIQDIIALLAINRPAALQQGQLQAYVEGKRGKANPNPVFQKICSDSYGALIYQEQTQAICREIAQLDWATTYKIIKKIDQPVPPGDPLQKAFVDGAVAHSQMDPQEAADLYYKATRYSFNKGHSAGYGIISYYMMYFKVHHPLAFYYSALANCADPVKIKMLQTEAVNRGIPIILPHVNGSATYQIVKYRGDMCIQIGTATIKDVGAVAAKSIIENQPFTSEAQMMEKIKKETNRKLNSKALNALRPIGALEFDMEKFHKLVISYNTRMIKNVL